MSYYFRALIFMNLDVTSLAPGIILQAPARRSKSFPNGYIDFFVRHVDFEMLGRFLFLRLHRAVQAGFVFDHHLSAGHTYIDAHVMEAAILPAMLRCRDHNSATDDRRIELLQLGRLLSDLRFDPVGMRGVAKSDLNWLSRKFLDFD